MTKRTESFQGKAIVMDLGSGLSKVGFSGEDQPQFTFPTLVGHLKQSEIISDVETDSREYFIGEDALNLRSVLQLGHPLDRGVVHDWNALENLWHFIFYELLRVNPSERPVLLMIAPQTSVKDKERMAEIIFETFNVPALYITSCAVLSLLSIQRNTGLVIEAGDGVIFCVPVVDGFEMSHGITRIELAGRDITKHLQRLLKDQGHGYLGMEVVQDIKEKLCYVALDLEKEKMLAEKDAPMKKEYTLPNGEVITINAERFLAPEILFNPSLIGKSELSVPEALHEFLSECGLDVKLDLYPNIVLSGGTTMFPGLRERLFKELLELMPDSRNSLRVVAPPHRHYGAWIGGSILTSLKSFQQRWLTRKRYQEEGPNVIHLAMW